MPAKFTIPIAISLAIVAACSAMPTELGRDIGFVHMVYQGLEHTITVTPSRAAVGDTVTIISEVTNRTPRSKAVHLRTCGLDVNTSLDFPWPGLQCGGYSARGSIQPGSTVRGHHIGVVNSAPGEYILRIRHVLEPEIWMEVPLIVE